MSTEPYRKRTREIASAVDNPVPLPGGGFGIPLTVPNADTHPEHNAATQDFLKNVRAAGGSVIELSTDASDVPDWRGMNPTNIANMVAAQAQTAAKARRDGTLSHVRTKLATAPMRVLAKIMDAKTPDDIKGFTDTLNCTLDELWAARAEITKERDGMAQSMRGEPKLRETVVARTPEGDAAARRAQAVARTSPEMIQQVLASMDHAEREKQIASMFNAAMERGLTRDQAEENTAMLKQALAQGPDAVMKMLANSDLPENDLSKSPAALELYNKVPRIAVHETFLSYCGGAPNKVGSVKLRYRHPDADDDLSVWLPDGKRDEFLDHLQKHDLQSRLVLLTEGETKATTEVVSLDNGETITMAEFDRRFPGRRGELTTPDSPLMAASSSLQPAAIADLFVDSGFQSVRCLPGDGNTVIVGQKPKALGAPITTERVPSSLANGYLSFEQAGPRTAGAVCIDYTPPQGVHDDDDDSPGPQDLWVPGNRIEWFMTAIRGAKKSGELRALEIVTHPPDEQANARRNNLRLIEHTFDLAHQVSLRHSEPGDGDGMDNDLFRHLLHQRMVDHVMALRSKKNGPRLVNASNMNVPWTLGVLANCVSVDSIISKLIYGPGSTLFASSVTESSGPIEWNPEKSLVAFDPARMTGLCAALLSEALDCALISHCVTVIVNSLPEDPAECFNVLKSQSASRVPGDPWDKLGLLARAACWWRSCTTKPPHGAGECVYSKEIIDRFPNKLVCSTRDEALALALGGGAEPDVTAPGGVGTRWARWPMRWMVLNERHMTGGDGGGHRTAVYKNHQIFEPKACGYECYSGSTPEEVATILKSSLAPDATDEMRAAVEWNASKQLDLSRVHLWRRAGAMQHGQTTFAPTCRMNRLIGEDPDSPLNPEIDWVNVLQQAMMRLDTVQTDVALDRIFDRSNQLTYTATRTGLSLLEGKTEDSTCTSLQVCLGIVLQHWDTLEREDRWPKDSRKQLIGDTASSEVRPPYLECLDSVFGHLCDYLHKTLMSDDNASTWAFLSALFFNDHRAMLSWVNAQYTSLHERRRRFGDDTRPTTPQSLRYWVLTTSQALTGKEPVQGPLFYSIYCDAPKDSVVGIDMAFAGMRGSAWDGADAARCDASYSQQPHHARLLHTLMLHSEEPIKTMRWYVETHTAACVRAAILPDVYRMVSQVSDGVWGHMDVMYGWGETTLPNYMIAKGEKPGGKVDIMMTWLEQHGQGCGIKGNLDRRNDPEHPKHASCILPRLPNGDFDADKLMNTLSDHQSLVLSSMINEHGKEEGLKRFIDKGLPGGRSSAHEITKEDLDYLKSLSQDDVRRLAGPIAAMATTNDYRRCRARAGFGTQSECEAEVEARAKQKLANAKQRRDGKKKAPPTTSISDELNAANRDLYSALERFTNEEYDSFVHTFEHAPYVSDLTKSKALYDAKLDAIRRVYEHKVSADTWKYFLDFEQKQRRFAKEHLAELKQLDKEKKDEVARANAIAKINAAYDEELAFVTTTLEKARAAWDRWIESGHVDAEALKEATSRPKTAKKRIADFNKPAPQAPIQHEISPQQAEDEIDRQKAYHDERKRQEREAREQELREEANTVPFVPERVAIPVEVFDSESVAGSSANSSPAETSPPVSTLTHKQRKKLQKERRQERMAEEAAREAAIRARQQDEAREEEELAAAMEASRIEAEQREEVQRQATASAVAELERRETLRLEQAQREHDRRRNAFRLSPVQHVGPNGHVSTIYTNRPPANHWEHQAAQRRELAFRNGDLTHVQPPPAAAAPAPPVPEPIVSPPTLAALAGSSTAPPESTIGAARCIVCMDDDKDQLFLPCKHVACCFACASKIMKTKKECPLCRAGITQVIGGVKF